MNKAELEKLNNTTWEELHPDWQEHGDLTDRFAKSEFDNCPGCGTTDNIYVYVATEDMDVAVCCTFCRWQIDSDCPSHAIDKWNTRAQ